MYVQCERCKTEYDFDDALVSERGTTVKCTSCGHQFKIRRTSESSVEDRWVVRTHAGATHVFTSLRELQKAILGRQVGKADVLSRGTAPPRPLGTIAELEPFFEERRPSRPPSDEHRSSRPPPIPGAVASSLSAPPRRSRVDTLRPPTGLGAAPPAVARGAEAAAPLAQTVAALESSHVGPAPRAPTPIPVAPVAPAPAPAPPRVVAAAPAPNTAPPAAAPAHLSQAVSVAPAPPVVQAATNPPELSSPLPPATIPGAYAEPRMGSLLDHDPAVHSIPPPRRMGGKVIIGMLLVGMLLVGAYIARPYFVPAGGSPPSTATIDPKVQSHVAEGERAMAEGDLEQASTSFAAARALAEKDPRVLLDVARVTNAKADVGWLDVRLQEGGTQESVRLAKQHLDDLAPRAKQAADAALEAAPDDPAAVRAKIDALRLSGDLAGARALAPRIASTAIEPETAYVLAALDLAEPGPPLKSVIERLRTASAHEGNLGRARAALVYALARSGDVAGARQELQGIVAMTRPHPLLPSLRAFVDRAQTPGVGVDAGKAVATVDVSALPPQAGAGGPDARALLQQADAAKNRGELEKARQLYGQALAKEPTSSEALGGLGDVARAQRDYANAQTYYRRAITENAQFSTAYVGLGDVLWESGDRLGAQKIYKDIVDRFPVGAYPGYVKQRSETAVALPAAPATQAPTASASSDPPNPESP
jgi:predicted Zn finger-like uncharacterized protein